MICNEHEALTDSKGDEYDRCALCVMAFSTVVGSESKHILEASHHDSGCSRNGRHLVP